MEGNPYFTLAKLMEPGKPAECSLLTGKVTSISPLAVETAGLKLAGPALMVSHQLTAATSGTCVVPGAGSGTCSIPPALKIGDSVLLVTSDYQLFFILCKVVAA